MSSKTDRKEINLLWEMSSIRNSLAYSGSFGQLFSGSCQAVLFRWELIESIFEELFFRAVRPRPFLSNYVHNLRLNSETCSSEISLSDETTCWTMFSISDCFNEPSCSTGIDWPTLNWFINLWVAGITLNFKLTVSKKEIQCWWEIYNSNKLK